MSKPGKLIEDSVKYCVEIRYKGGPWKKALGRMYDRQEDAILSIACNDRIYNSTANGYECRIVKIATTRKLVWEMTPAEPGA